MTNNENKLYTFINKHTCEITRAKSVTHKLMTLLRAISKNKNFKLTTMFRKLHLLLRKQKLKINTITKKYIR